MKKGVPTIVVIVAGLLGLGTCGTCVVSISKHGNRTRCEEARAQTRKVLDDELADEDLTKNEAVDAIVRARLLVTTAKGACEFAGIELASLTEAIDEKVDIRKSRIAKLEATRKKKDAKQREAKAAADWPEVSRLVDGYLKAAKVAIAKGQEQEALNSIVKADAALEPFLETQISSTKPFESVVRELDVLRGSAKKAIEKKSAAAEAAEAATSSDGSGGCVCADGTISRCGRGACSRHGGYGNGRGKSSGRSRGGRRR